MTALRGLTSPATTQAILREILEPDSRIVAAWQYGSSLRSDYDFECSDIDILVVATETATLEDYLEIAHKIRARVATAEATVLRLSEIEAAIHPGWSRHYFVNVSRSGVRLCGPDCLRATTSVPLSLHEAYRRLVQFTQRARLALINPSKANEVAFWLGKYQHWIPLCLMELLELAGTPEDRLRFAQESFSRHFPGAGLAISYPYVNLQDLAEYLESLVQWIARHPDEFGAGPADTGHPA